MKLVVLSVLAFAVLVAILVYLVYTNSVFGVGPISIGVQVAAALLMLWARFTFGLRSFNPGANTTKGALVTHGPYGVVRNPIYAAILVFLAGSTAAHPSWISLGLFLVAVGAVLVRIFSEEVELRTRYADEYAEYTRRVKRLVPLVY